ncbi:MAG: hypothetical protein JWM55_387 [Acidimicrobiaceae bacterium]|nr:hypothetical protein [Acidimicrobiaceae bacterium]
MNRQPRDGRVLRDEGRIYPMHWRLITIALVVVLILSGLLLFGRTRNGSKYSISGGSPYPLSELLADSVTKSVPASYHSIATNAIANIPSHATLLKSLDSSGVNVSFDGATFSNSDIAGGEAGCLQAAIEVTTTNAYEQNLDPSTAVSELESSSFCLDQAVALDVYKKAEVRAAINSGNGATVAQAKSYAQQELANYESLQGTPNALPLSPGETLESVITCSACIAGYQTDLDLQYETQAITGSTATGATQNTELLNWFSDVLQNSNSLSIANIPGATSSNLPSFLPIASEEQSN